MPPLNETKRLRNPYHLKTATRPKSARAKPVPQTTARLSGQGNAVSQDVIQRPKFGSDALLMIATRQRLERHVISPTRRILKSS